MSRKGDTRNFRKAVVVSVAVHIGLFIIILASPSLPKPSKKRMIHYLPLSMYSLGGGGGPGSGGSGGGVGGGAKAGAQIPAKKETLRDLTVPQKAAKEDTASSLHFPTDKPQKDVKKKAAITKPDPKAAAETDVKDAGTQAGVAGGAGTGSGIRFGTGGGTGGGAGGFGTGYGDQLGLANFPFEWYLRILQDKISSEWFKSLIDPGVSGQFQTVVTFRIQKDGRITDVQVEQQSGVPSLDDSARRAVMKAAPFPSLPKEYEQEYLVIHLIFEHSK